eukprot:4458969-Pleurochrysis_carterae.AAC.1
MMYSLPASRAARKRLAVRRISSFDCSSSRKCWGGTSGRPSMCSRSRTGGGPPSDAALDAKKRDTEKVEQGGEATMAAYMPDLQRSSRRW